ncbi:MAG: tRNA (adenosine(37)-N6)-threonylcarbamoyltransferase complex dimerization subunit type 1 TsaB [Pseudomonadota bacterium]
MILGLDTSADQCMVALVGQDHVLSRSEAMSLGHAERLFPMIEDVLEEAGVGFANLARVAVCVGPGSFTGLRVGVAAARGLALGCGIPAIGVTRFEAVWDGACDMVALPGRPGQIYVQRFGADGPLGKPEIRNGEAASLLADVERIARLAAGRDPGPMPAPLYLRPADAAPSKDQPPPRIV